MKLWTVASALIAAALSVVPAAAATIPFSAILSPANEVPPTASTGSGTAILDLDVVAHTLRVQITFSGLVPTAPAGSPVGTTASHIHCCLTSPFATGVNAGVATTTPTFAGFPLGVLAGTYDNTLDLTSASSYNPAFVTSPLVGGSVANAEATLINGLLSGLTYLNVHTNAFPGGEIRGFVVQVPEPETYALLLAGLAVIGIAMRKRRRT
ncbi:MAG TPA: CHRD domain-containing protein [Burkholderiales bacterium]|nr:CHRD domain-containing protein [Burkholderiales bacterium]